MRTTTSATDSVAPAEPRELDASPRDDATLESPREETEGRRSRRSFVFFGALAAASLLPSTARAQARPKVRKPTPPPPLDVPPPNPGESVAPFAEWDATGVSRLVRRVTMGVTPGDMAKANQLGWQGYLNQQLNYTRINDDAVENFIVGKWPLMSQTSDTLFSADAGTVRTQLQESTIYRAAFSARQLYQRMVEFWTDHFNQDIDKVGYLLVADQRDVIRKNALGKFPDLLKASAHSASMMAYLDQNTSNNRAPNQNYAREIMELHTLGVDGGYTQDDVAELSRVLTGWTITGRGVFTFNPNIHDTGTKTVLGTTIQGQTGAAGINEGEQVLDMLVNHPSTAKFIATKMLKWLLDPNPSDAQIATVASVYKATGGDIRAMIRVILNDSWLPAAPMKFKRPFHFVTSSLRSTNPSTVAAVSGMNGQLGALGQQMFTWDTPDGFPDKIEYWSGNIVPRWGFANVMAAQNSATAIVVSTAPYLAGSTAAALDLINQNFFAGEIPIVTQQGLLTYAGTTTLTDAKVRELIALAISANAFQWY
jgi:uncharacterized protein (DUF1800 family)